MHSGWARRGTCRETGQNQMEHIGLVVLVGAVVATLVATSALTALPGQFRAAICQVFRDDCPEGDVQAGQRPHEYYRPGKCRTSLSKDTYGASVTAFSVRVGQSVSFAVKKMSDGSTYVTATGGASVGGVASAGADVSAGRYLRAGVGGDAFAKAGVQVGDTWAFDSEDQARDFIDEFRTRSLIDQGSTFSLAGLAVDAYEEISGNQVFVPDEPEISQVKVSLDAGASGFAGIAGGGRGSSGSGNPDSDNWRTSDVATAKAGVQVGRSGTIQVNRETGDRTLKVAIEGEIEGGVYAAGHPVPVPGTDAQTAGSAKYKGAAHVTTDSDGNIKRVRFVRTTGLNNGLDDTATTVTTTLQPQNARQERVIQQWLFGRGMVEGLKTFPWSDMAPASAADADTPFDRLLYEQGEVSKVTYDNATNPVEIGLDVGAGLKFGGALRYASEDSTVTDAEYLGAPRNNQRGFVPYEECHSDG